METREWILKRNCSIAPRQLAWVYAILCAVSLAVALAFTLHGAWAILIFSVIELSAVGIAFLVYARHATDQEHVILDGARLVVELTQAGRTARTALDIHQAQLLRIVPGQGYGALVTIEAPGVLVEVGRFLDEWQRREFARELQRELSARTG